MNRNKLIKEYFDAPNKTRMEILRQITETERKILAKHISGPCNGISRMALYYMWLNAKGMTPEEFKKSMEGDE